jgi:hypothetical protein
MRLLQTAVPFLLAVSAVAAPPRWAAKRANAWYARQPWLVGANYTPSSAINPLEMWQAETFDANRIDTELGWAEDVGMNSMRVFLHDLAWEQDAQGFLHRIEAFLTVAARHHIRPVFVLFDSCWDPAPKPGRQREPVPGVHNSGWVQSPGADALRDPAQRPRLEAYVKGVVGAFGKDERVLAWDVWNEPDNTNGSSYGDREPPNKVELVLALLPEVFAWAREAGAMQPLTSGVWQGEWWPPAKLSAMARVQIEQSDVISFHSYDPPARFRERIRSLQRYGRPILCTEYMARPNGSTFEGSLPIARKYRVAAYNWGLVAGKTQTTLPWDSWKKPYVDRQAPEWFHDVFLPDGRPYRPAEAAFLRRITGRGAPASESAKRTGAR